MNQNNIKEKAEEDIRQRFERIEACEQAVVEAEKALSYAILNLSATHGKTFKYKEQWYQVRSRTNAKTKKTLAFICKLKADPKTWLLGRRTNQDALAEAERLQARAKEAALAAELAHREAQEANEASRTQELAALNAKAAAMAQIEEAARRAKVATLAAKAAEKNAKLLQRARKANVKKLIAQQSMSAAAQHEKNESVAAQEFVQRAVQTSREIFDTERVTPPVLHTEAPVEGPLVID